MLRVKGMNRVDLVTKMTNWGSGVWTAGSVGKRKGMNRVDLNW